MHLRRAISAYLWQYRLLWDVAKKFPVWENILGVPKFTLLEGVTYRGGRGGHIQRGEGGLHYRGGRLHTEIVIPGPRMSIQNHENAELISNE